MAYYADVLGCQASLIYASETGYRLFDETNCQELTADGQKKGMRYTFNSSGRRARGALSYIHVETRARSMLLQAFHTIPDDHAIVKSQSLFKLP